MPRNIRAKKVGRTIKPPKLYPQVSVEKELIAKAL
jgi:hypothetical protein